MGYKVKVIGVQSGIEKPFYIYDSLDYWLADHRAAASIYHSLEAAKSVINQGIVSIKQELNLFHHYELKEIQIVKEVIVEDVIQTLKPSDI